MLFRSFTEKASKKKETILMESGKPLVFGENNELGVKLDGFSPVVVNLNEGASANDLWIHDERDRVKAGILARFFDNPRAANENHLPRPFGVFYVEDRPTYEDDLYAQIDSVRSKKGKIPLNKILSGDKTWTIA